MKNEIIDTTIVRHIDDLGRLVVPKDIRAQMDIHEGDTFSVLIDKKNNAVIFKKHSNLTDSQK